MKVLDSIWFTPIGGSLIGIVKAEVEYEGIKYYIGHASGLDEDADALNIAERGARFPADAAEKLFS
jgi:hypothetical protein